jgi:amidohydrolase
MMGEAATRALGAGAVVPTQQSLGGEDFAWYLESIPGGFARLGTRSPETGVTYDIHQGTFDVDERAIAMGVRLMATTALTALFEGGHLPSADEVTSALA